ncbi:MAG: hypothetical protein JWM74_2460 [Myxococcaceae bacterium]|jgi:hypothetical protein|nr:hypothetical protein [Myxococcaceae bacterium]
MGSMPTLDSIRLDVSAWKPVKTARDMRMWRRGDDEELSIHLFDSPPDIGAPLDDVAALRAFYGSMVASGGVALVSVDLRTIGTPPLSWIEVILELPAPGSAPTLDPGGYSATLTLPRRDFSFVLKLQCGAIDRLRSTLDALEASLVVDEGVRTSLPPPPVPDGA